MSLQRLSARRYGTGTLPSSGSRDMVQTVPEGPPMTRARSTDKRSFRRRQATVHHEAGHCVAAYRLAPTLVSAGVTIVPHGTTVGRDVGEGAETWLDPDPTQIEDYIGHAVRWLRVRGAVRSGVR